MCVSKATASRLARDPACQNNAPRPRGHRANDLVSECVTVVFLVSGYTVIEPFLFPRHVDGCSMLHIHCWEWWMRHWSALADSSFHTQGISGVNLCLQCRSCTQVFWPTVVPLGLKIGTSSLGGMPSQASQFVDQVFGVDGMMMFVTFLLHQVTYQVVWEQAASLLVGVSPTSWALLCFTDRCHMMAVWISIHQYSVWIQLLFSLRDDSLAALIAQALHGGDDRRFCESTATSRIPVRLNQACCLSNLLFGWYCS